MNRIHPKTDAIDANLTTVHPKNFICNFRAPDEERFQIWQDFKRAAEDQGLDICFVTLSLCDSWTKNVNGTRQATTKIATSNQIIYLQQQNTFVYSVGKPRREPFVISSSRKSVSGTVRSLALQAYVTEKARDLGTSFSFLDFPELGANLFRKLVLKLKNRQKIKPLEPRSNPRCYILTEWVPLYPTACSENRVKPLFTTEGRQQ